MIKVYGICAGVLMAVFAFGDINFSNTQQWIKAPYALHPFLATGQASFQSQATDQQNLALARAKVSLNRILKHHIALMHKDLKSVLPLFYHDALDQSGDLVFADINRRLIANLKPKSLWFDRGKGEVHVALLLDDELLDEKILEAYEMAFESQSVFYDYVRRHKDFQDALLEGIETHFGQ